MRLVVISAIWCPSCLILNKHLKKLEEVYPHLEIKKLDYDFDSSDVEKYNVKKILPVIVLEDDEKELKRLVGEVEYDDLVHFIEEV